MSMYNNTGFIGFRVFWPSFKIVIIIIFNSGIIKLFLPPLPVPPFNTTTSESYDIWEL